MRKWYDIDAQGVSSLSGEKWVKVTDRKKVGYVPLAECMSQASLRARLIEQEIIVASGDKAARLAEQIDGITEYEEELLIDHSGWIGSHFALPDGTVFSPEGEAAPTIVFDVDQQKCATAGTLKAWKRDVLEPLNGHAVPMFAIMLAFMPPLLRLSEITGNFGFELVGPPGTGKSTVQLLACSALGGIGRGDNGASYCMTFNATLNALEQHMAAHSDLPMFIEEANLFLADEAAASRAKAFKAFAFRIGGGKGKERWGVPTDRTHRVSYLSSSNESLASLIGEQTDVARAAGDRLITLQIPDDGTYGVFSKVPEGFNSTSQAAKSLVAAATANHGRGIRRFLTHLVQERATDEAGLKETIRQLVERFTTKAGVDVNDGSAMRVAEAFGLVYAAGVLAMKYKVLPASWKCGHAVLSCYQEYRVAPATFMPFVETLKQLAGSDAAVHMVKGESLEAMAVTGAEVLVRDRKGSREVMIVADAIEKLVPGWTAMRSRADVKVLMHHEAGRLTVKRKLHPQLEPRRVYSFTIPKEDVS